MITISRLTLGGKVTVNFPAVVNPEGSAPLLRQSALFRAGKFRSRRDLEQPEP